MRRSAHFIQRPVSQPAILPNAAANEDMSESEGMPFMPTSLESGYQTKSFGKMSDLLEQNMPFNPLPIEHITSEWTSGSDQIYFDPDVQESEYQPQDNKGYDYQELPVQHMPFNPTLH